MMNRKKYEQCLEMVQDQLVDSCTSLDRYYAHNDIPTDIDEAMQTAWIKKDNNEYMRLLRILMYKYFEETAQDQVEYYINIGEIF